MHDRRVFKSLGRGWGRPARDWQLLPGFTLVELLAVIAILGLLMALLLPAVQGVRENARLSACQNNLRQLGIAIQRFETQHGVYPSAVWFEMGSSGMAQLLPHLEQEAIYSNLVNAASPAQDQWNAWFNNSYAGQAPLVSAFICPSVRTPAANEPRNCYMFSTGDHLASDNWGGGNRGLVLCFNDNNNYAKGPGAPDDPKWWRSRARNSAKCTDGLSNTIFMAERVYGLAGDPRLLKIGHASVQDWSKPGMCAAVATGSRYADTATVLADVGSNWARGHPGFITFSTIFPPNGPSCNIVNGPWWGSATSLHAAGGVNTVFGDGSVRFISELIDATSRPAGSDNPVDLPFNRGGPSPFGVWGALGSFSGGERVEAE